MNKTTKVTLVCGLLEDNDWWYFYFGHKGNALYSPRIPSKEMAYKWMNDEVNQAKNQYGEGFEITVERKDSS